MVREAIWWNKLVKWCETSNRMFLLNSRNKFDISTIWYSQICAIQRVSTFRFVLYVQNDYYLEKKKIGIWYSFLFISNMKQDRTLRIISIQNDLQQLALKRCYTTHINWEWMKIPRKSYALAPFNFKHSESTWKKKQFIILIIFLLID